MYFVVHSILAIKLSLIHSFFFLGKKEEIWILDNFIIDGNNLKNPVILFDTFDFGPREDNWFFYPGGNIGLYCPYSSKGAPCVLQYKNCCGNKIVTLIK